MKKREKPGSALGAPVFRQVYITFDQSDLRQGRDPWHHMTITALVHPLGMMVIGSLGSPKHLGNPACPGSSVGHHDLPTSRSSQVLFH